MFLRNAATWLIGRAHAITILSEFEIGHVLYMPASYLGPPAPYCILVWTKIPFLLHLFILHLHPAAAHGAGVSENALEPVGLLGTCGLVCSRCPNSYVACPTSALRLRPRLSIRGREASIHHSMHDNVPSWWKNIGRSSETVLLAPRWGQGLLGACLSTPVSLVGAAACGQRDWRTTAVDCQ
jgi:hypothetical protein